MYLFVLTHLGNAADSLCYSLSSHPLIQYSPGGIYQHGDDLLTMRNGLISFDRISENHCLSKHLYSSVKIILAPSPPGLAISSMINRGIDAAVRIYCYRLRRMYEIARLNKCFFADLENPSNNLHTWLGLGSEIRWEAVVDEGKYLEASRRYLYYRKILAELCNDI